MLQGKNWAALVLMALSTFGCATKPLQLQTLQSSVPAECREVCRPIPAWHPRWELEMVELYSECAVGKALCARELLK